MQVQPERPGIACGFQAVEQLAEAPGAFVVQRLLAVVEPTALIEAPDERFGDSRRIGQRIEDRGRGQILQRPVAIAGLVSQAFDFGGLLGDLQFESLA